MLGISIAITSSPSAKDFFLNIDKPFVVAGNVFTSRVVTFFNSVIHLSELGKENQALIKENLALQSELAILKEVQNENEILKKELGIFKDTTGNFQLYPATIIGRSNAGYLKDIVIDQGSKQNIRVGQAVVSQGYLVGTVSKVYDNSSEVILITDYNSLVPVILADSRGTGLLRGGIGGLSADEIPLNIPIKQGENVVTSGLGGDIPSGILVGKTNQIISREGEVFQKVTVNSPVQMYLLEFVFVVS